MRWNIGDRIYTFWYDDDHETFTVRCGTVIGFDRELHLPTGIRMMYVQFECRKNPEEIPYGSQFSFKADEMIARLNEFYTDAENRHRDQLQAVRDNVDIHIANIQKDFDDCESANEMFRTGPS